MWNFAPCSTVRVFFQMCLFLMRNHTESNPCDVIKITSHKLWNENMPRENLFVFFFSPEKNLIYSHIAFLFLQTVNFSAMVQLRYFAAPRRRVIVKKLLKISFRMNSPSHLMGWPVLLLLLCFKRESSAKILTSADMQTGNSQIH